MARSLQVVSGAVVLSILSCTAVAVAADVTCYVDSVGGSDTNKGTSETDALASPAKVDKSCTTVKFKRGSLFKLATGTKNLGLTNINSIKTLTNYGDAAQPLPKFVKDHVNGSGGMIQVFNAVTIDGLYLEGSKSGSAMSQLADGIGVMLGAGSKLINSEITLCGIGVMTSGDNVQVLNNYIHDLSISVDAPPGVDPNQVGGAEGIFVNSSHVEVAYNRFINCSTAAAWVTNTNGGGVRCDGGATEVTVPYAGEVTDLHIHHNFSYNSCGMFEVSTMPNPDDPDGSKKLPYTKGKFTNSEFHDNVVVDSGWISLLQINNTKLTNVRWEHNTLVHHFLPTIDGKDPTGKIVKIDMNDYASSYIQVIAFNSVSSGVSAGGELAVGDVFWTNNLWYFDPSIKNFSPTDATHASSDQFVKNITISGDKVFREDPGFVDITSTTDPHAYDLKKGSPAIDVGVTNVDITKDVPTDFVERPRPAGAAYDLGAFEYQGDAAGGITGAGGSPVSASTLTNPASSGGGTPGVGGAKAASGAPGIGGVKSGGGATNKGAAGSPSAAKGGAAPAANGGATTATPVPGAGGAKGASVAAQGSGPAANTSPTAQPTGGQSVVASTSQSSQTSQPSAAGGQVGNGTTATGGSNTSPGSGSPTVDPFAASAKDNGCNCRTAGSSSNGTAGLGLLAMAAMMLGRSRRRRGLRCR